MCFGHTLMHVFCHGYSQCIRGDLLQSDGRPSQLVTIHRRLSQGRGRRTLELSPNRSIVVLAIASWQAYIEELARALLVSLGPPDDRSTSGRTLTVLWHSQRQDLDKQIKNYSTANADNTINLLSALGFDPGAHWTWVSVVDK